MTVDVGIYVPQIAFTFEQMLERAQRIEALGYRSLWLYDHLDAPGVPGASSLEAWTLATALLARTERLRVGHLVLCANFRHPALLGRMVATLDAISGGRFDVGLGSGSIESEHLEAGLPWGTASERTARLRESLEAVRSIPERTPPIIVGGAGERFTLPLVARYADIWNVPTYALGELDAKLDALRRACDEIGRDPATIRLSIEAVLALARDEAALPDVRAVAERRFGAPAFGLHDGGLLGTPPQVLDRLGELCAKGFDHVILFTHDRASDETLSLFADEVLARLR